jgi:rhamnose transport system permease protein
MTTLLAPERREPERTYPSYSRPLVVRLLATREFAVFALLVGVFLYATANVEFFDGPLTLYFLFRDLAPVLVVALPMTLIIMTGEIDLSVASTMGLSAVVMAMLHFDAGWSVPAAAAVAVVVGTLCGAFNGFLVAYVGLPSLAVTIGTLALFRGIAVGLTGTTQYTGFPQEWRDLALDRISEGSRFPLVLVPIGILSVLFLVLLHFTTFGRGVFEIGLNDEAARFTGVNVERTKFLLFIMAGAVAAMAGIYFALIYNSARGNTAEGTELKVIAAVLLGGVSIFGGRGALPGVIAGALLIGVLSSALRLESVEDNQINIIIGVLLILSVVSGSLLVSLRGLLRRLHWRGSAPPAPDLPGEPGPTAPPGPTTRTTVADGSSRP